MLGRSRGRKAVSARAQVTQHARGASEQLEAMGRMGSLPEREQLKAGVEQKAWVTSFACTAAGACISAASSPACSAGEGVASAFLGFAMADLVTGIFHWGVDNYGDEATPVFGPVIDAFQGHHNHPWVIAEREVANNLGSVAKAATFLILPLPFMQDVDPHQRLFLVSLLSNAALSQQYHAWAHSKPSRNPEPVRVLQRAGILLSSREHAVHHRSPHAVKYCIVNGWWNPVLDSLGVFSALEKVILRLGGPVPRCWLQSSSEDD